jgi:hypothetical protein
VAERRTSRRRAFHELPHIAAVKVSSEAVEVIDASAGGLLVEGPCPLRPGMSSYVDIIEAAGTSVRVSGSVVRCQIAALGPNKPRYRFAIAFERAVPLIDDAPQAAVAAAEPQSPFAVEDAAVPGDAAFSSLNNW